MKHESNPATNPAAQQFTPVEAIELAAERGWYLYINPNLPTVEWLCRGTGNRLVGWGKTAGEAYNAGLRYIGGTQ